MSDTVILPMPVAGFTVTGTCGMLRVTYGGIWKWPAAAFSLHWKLPEIETVPWVKITLPPMPTTVVGSGPLHWISTPWARLTNDTWSMLSQLSRGGPVTFTLNGP